MYCVFVCVCTMFLTFCLLCGADQCVLCVSHSLHKTRHDKCKKASSKAIFIRFFHTEPHKSEQNCHITLCDCVIIHLMFAIAIILNTYMKQMDLISFYPFVWFCTTLLKKREWKIVFLSCLFKKNKEKSHFPLLQAATSQHNYIVGFQPLMRLEIVNFNLFKFHAKSWCRLKKVKWKLLFGCANMK